MNRLALALSAALLATANVADASTRVELGVLECRSAGSTSFLVGSVREIGCTFRPAGGGAPETYVGTVRRFGLDFGVNQRTVMVWAVFAPTSLRGPGELAGGYGGVSAEATFAVGLGANVLLGGSNRTIALQPLSVEATTGLNIALGVTDLELRSVR
jgi:hypothetical protein